MVVRRTPRFPPRVGSLVDPWWTLEGGNQARAAGPLPAMRVGSGVSMTARQSGLRPDIFRQPRETAFRSGTAIAPDGFEPSTSRL